MADIWFVMKVPEPFDPTQEIDIPDGFEPFAATGDGFILCRVNRYEYRPLAPEQVPRETSVGPRR